MVALHVMERVSLPVTGYLLIPGLVRSWSRVRQEVLEPRFRVGSHYYISVHCLIKFARIYIQMSNKGLFTEMRHIAGNPVIEARANVE